MMLKGLFYHLPHLHQQPNSERAHVSARLAWLALQRKTTELLLALTEDESCKTFVLEFFLHPKAYNRFMFLARKATQNLINRPSGEEQANDPITL